MRYASEHAGVLTSVHQWKPIPADRFTQLLHHYTTAVCDRHGSDALSTTALALDREATATIYYRRKERGHCVSSPALMTMEGPAGKTLCFETTNPDFALDPKPAAEVVRDARAYVDLYRSERLTEVATAAAKASQVYVRNSAAVLLIVPNSNHAEVPVGAFKRAGGDSAGLKIVPSTDLGSIRRGPYAGVWLHNAGMFSGALSAVMDQIAELQQGAGWLGMTGDTGMGWPAPDGLPKERI